jgi:hypothetical protein
MKKGQDMKGIKHKTEHVKKEEQNYESNSDFVGKFPAVVVYSVTPFIWIWRATTHTEEGGELNRKL